jgi:hypothetical protein
MDKVRQLKDTNLLEDIMRDNKITQSQLSKITGRTRQEISFVMKGKRRLSGKVLEAVKECFPNYFNDSPKFNVIEIPYYSKTPLPLYSVLPEMPDGVICLDKQLFNINTPVDIKLSSCAIVGISDDSLSPVYEQGDRVIIDLSKTEFINNQIYCFILDGVCYIRRIILLPDKIKCISPKQEDTFYITKDNKPKILGLILPRIRF